MAIEFDLNMFLNTLVAGGAVWAAIRADVRHLRADVDRLMNKVFR